MAIINVNHLVKDYPFRKYCMLSKTEISYYRSFRITSVIAFIDSSIHSCVVKKILESEIEEQICKILNFCGRLEPGCFFI